MILHLASLLTTTSTTVAAPAKSTGGLLDPIAKPIAGILAGIYSVIPNFGVAILVLSVIWMVIISPLTLKSTRSMLAMQKLQPQLKALQEKHKNDRQAFAQAQMDLFREHQVSPFGSCLPMLLPMPVFFALFRVIDGLSHTIGGSQALSTCGAKVCYTPRYLSHTTQMFKDIVSAHGHLNAFGMDLSQNAFSHHSSVAAAMPFWILLLIMAGTSYFQTAQTMSRNPSASQNPQMRMMKYLPFLFVLFCIKFPAGVILYYAMSNVCRIIQQDAMYRFDPKVKALVAQEVAEVEAITRDIDDQHRPIDGKGKTAQGKSGDGTGKRTRFRDLLASAAEQQRKTQAQKAKGTGSTARRPGGTAGGKGGGPTLGKALGTGSTGSAGANKPGSNGQRGGGQSGGGQAGGGQSGGGQAGRGQGARGQGGQRSGGGRSQSGSRRNRRRRGR